MAINSNIDGTPLVKQAVALTLRALREQRDRKQVQELDDTYDFNPQIFQYGVHYIAGPVEFKNPFRRTPRVVFGAISGKVVEDTTPINHPIATGFTPLVIYPYVYGFEQSAGAITGFYLGLHALTPIPLSATKYTIAWHARGLASPYPQHRIGEAWSTAYNKNEPEYMTNNVSS